MQPKHVFDQGFLFTNSTYNFFPWLEKSCDEVDKLVTTKTFFANEIPFTNFGISNCKYELWLMLANCKYVSTIQSTYSVFNFKIVSFQNNDIID